jgi:competence protein ComEA
MASRARVRARVRLMLSTDERRALAIIAGLLVLASLARWLERPQPLLSDLPAIDVAALEEASRAGRDEPPTERPAGPIDPNTATAAELTRLSGIGPSLAARIVEERERAPFTTLHDLTRVRGIGAALATTLAGRLTLPAAPARLDAPADTALTPLKTASGAASDGPPQERLDVNYISSADLQKVRGVGPALAGRLMARRDSIGRFTSWEQVDEVAGVGPATLAKLKDSLVLRP